MAEPTVIAVDAAELKKVNTALESPGLKNRPKVFVIADGTDLGLDKTSLVVRKPLS